MPMRAYTSLKAIILQIKNNTTMNLKRYFKHFQSIYQIIFGIQCMFFISCSVCIKNANIRVFIILEWNLAIYPDIFFGNVYFTLEKKNRYTFKTTRKQKSTEPILIFCLYQFVHTHTHRHTYTCT